MGMDTSSGADSSKPASASGYAKPPWVFRGSALYQLHLVKSNIARACIPTHFHLVEAFGYTLGGFFLANYDHSPAGAFDELVVIAGLVWNPPTSCAWSTKVLVNSEEACKHGRKDVGLPSHVASFSKRIDTIHRRPGSIRIGLLNMNGIGSALSDSRDQMDVQVTEVRSPCASSSDTTSSFNITTSVPKLSMDNWMGPKIKMSLPSFSGCTEYNPDLLKYSCKIQCRVRPVRPAEVSSGQDGVTEQQSSQLSAAVMFSKPIFALEFNSMTMQVESPVVIPSSSSKTSVSTC